MPPEDNAQPGAKTAHGRTQVGLDRQRSVAGPFLSDSPGATRQPKTGFCISQYSRRGQVISGKPQDQQKSAFLHRDELPTELNTVHG